MGDFKIISFVLPVLLFFSIHTDAQRYSQSLNVTQEYILKRVNQLRANGCQCGNDYYKPAVAVTWNTTLEQTALRHAKEMQKYNFFSHRSRDGKDIGERFDQIGYKWQYAGENLAVGQKTFDEAFKDWIKSPTHCKMLMNANMNEMAVSRYGKYWVQHFGKKMPPKTKRRNVRYKEG